MASGLTAKSAELFYGTSARHPSRWQSVLEARLAKMKEHPIPEPYKPRLSSPTTYWRVYHRQQEALEFARQDSANELRVFSYESDAIGTEGQRLYVAASNEQFYHYYAQSAMVGKRHHYEVIGEGTPCKLYFDLEFPMETNAQLDGCLAVSTFKRYVCRQLHSHLGLVCTDVDIIDLDSSSSVKFSRHLIFVTPQLVFENNIHAGNFVRHICQPLLRLAAAHEAAAAVAATAAETGKQQPPASLPGGTSASGDAPSVSSTSALAADAVHSARSLAVQASPPTCSGCAKADCAELTLDLLLPLSKDGRRILLCDLGVYTKNRNFRLLHSSKRGKKEVLVLSANSDAYQQHLWARVPDAAQRDKQLFLDSLISDIPRMPPSLVTFDSCEQSGRSNGVHSSVSQDVPSISGVRQSPFAEIDVFIGDHLMRSQGLRPGTIRRWRYFADSETLVYDVANNRWCSRLQREHKSNNTMIVVRLNDGIYYRACHDPECRASGYEPDAMKLPAELLPRYYFVNANDDDFGDPTEALCTEVSSETLKYGQSADAHCEATPKDTPSSCVSSESSSTDSFMPDAFETDEVEWDPL